MLISGNAKEVAEEFVNSEFKVSNGWLNTFIRRHQIVFNEVRGEARDICEETAGDNADIALHYGKICPKG